MKILDSIKLQVSINNALNSLALALFFHFSLGNLVPIEFIFLYSVLVISIVKDLFLGIVSIVLSLATSSLIVEPELTGQFIVDNSSRNFILMVIFLSISNAILFRKMISSNDKKFDIHSHVTVYALLFCFKYIFDQINQQTSAQALRFLVYTGEDNAAWLNALQSGFKNKTDNVFSIPQATDVRETTYSWMILFRDVIFEFDNEKLLTDNALILQRFYFFVITLAILTVVTGILKILDRLQIVNSVKYLASFLIAIAIYLSASSFALSGHLTPILVLLHIYTALIFILNSFENIETKTNKLFYFFVIFVLVFSIRNIWFPLAPIVYFLVLCSIFGVIYQSKFWKNQKKLKHRTTILLSGFTGFAILLLETKEKITEIVAPRIENFVSLIHWPGGSLNPGALHIFAVFVFLYMIFANKDSKFKMFSSLEFKIIAFAFSMFYVFVVSVSIITKPYTIDYAGQKLGLLLVAILLPMNILYTLINLLAKTKDFFKVTVVSSAVLIFMIFAGSPTVSGNPAWPQSSYPFAVLNRINSEDTKIWEQALISQVNQLSTSEKKVLCFNRYNEAPDVTQSCSKFAQSLQGIYYEDFSRYWIEVNWNNSNLTDFQNNKPKDFEVRYKILFLDELKWPGTKAELNSIASNFPANYQ